MGQVSKPSKDDFLYSYERLVHGVQITVVPIFVDHESDPNENFFLWAYQVRVENKSQQPFRIVDRHWTVVDLQGNQKIITSTDTSETDTLLQPGDAVEHTNVIPLSTNAGIMSGRYACKGDSGDIFEIETPTFSLDSPYMSKVLH